MASSVAAARPESGSDSHSIDPKLINQCVHCGFCLQACPTYQLWGNEMDSPRGRIYLMKLATETPRGVSPEFVEHIDACLGCVSCMTACPSGVNYEKLIEEARAVIERSYERPWFDRLKRKVILATFPNLSLLRLLRPFVALAGKFSFADPRKIVPPIGKQEDVAVITPAQGVKRARVGLMLGCVQREWMPEINAATARVLAAEGCEVIAPKEQACCGALLTHGGQPDAGEEHARKLVDILEKAGVDAIITNAGGCGSHLRQFSNKCKDVAEFIAALGPRAEKHDLKMKVAYHDSCHLQHSQKVRTQPRELLSSIPGVTLQEMPEATLCCGSAGIYNIVQPQAADELGDRKAAHIINSEADVVVTGNIGCIMQMRAALARKGKSTPVLHTVQLLDQAIRKAQ